jgi:uncharacterized protein
MTAPNSLEVESQVILDTVRWLERAVIGLNLCPFAKAVHVKQQIHYAVCQSAHASEVLQCLHQELLTLANTPPEVRDTTLLMLPFGLEDFLDFNDFLNDAERVLVDAELDGVIQIASFHPAYQFADAQAGDVSNCTNRSPYPTLHLIREASIDRAVQAFANAHDIYEKNIETLSAMGQPGWSALDVGPRLDLSDTHQPKLS